MKACIIDASVAAKWLLPAAGEPLAEEALELLQEHVEGRLRMSVPDLFWAELANILWKAVRMRRLPEDAAEKALQSAMNREFPTIPSHALLEDAFALAKAFDRPVYDSLYVAAAVRLDCPLITADERLATALAPYLPVKSLASLRR